MSSSRLSLSYRINLIAGFVRVVVLKFDLGYGGLNASASLPLR